MAGERTTIQLIRRAIRADWPVTQKARKDAYKQVEAILNDPNSSKRTKFQAAKLLLEMDGHALDRLSAMLKTEKIDLERLKLQMAEQPDQSGDLTVRVVYEDDDEPIHDQAPPSLSPSAGGDPGPAATEADCGGAAVGEDECSDPRDPAGE